MLTPWISIRAEELWPDLSKPAAAVGGGAQDAGVVVGIDAYSYVPPVSGAEPNAKAWYDYLTRTRGAAPGNIKLLLGVDATRDDMLDAAQAAAAKAGPNGTLWFVFVGHGAPSADGKDGLLVGVDAQQKAESLQKRSLGRQELLAALAKSRASSISVILDACFSGRGPDGASIAPGLQPLVTVAAAGAVDPRIVVLTAARGDQFAGSLPGANRPAFSYLTLGALRGWAGGPDGRVTAGAIWRYATSALDATLRGRNQTPDLMGKEGAVVGASAGEKGPDLAALAKATAGGGGPDFQVSSLPAVPRAQAPKALVSTASGLDLGSVDVDALEKYDAASELDKGEAPAEEKAASWRTLANDTPKFAALAEKRALQWDRYAADRKTAEEAKAKRMEARDSDWAKLSRLLALKVVPAKDKLNWSAKFTRAYLEIPGIEPAAAKELVKHTAAGPAKEALAKLAQSAPTAALGAPSRSKSPVAAGKAGIQWVSIPGGTFMMSMSEWRTDHRITVKAFEMAKTEVTNKQYRACVEAGACSVPNKFAEIGKYIGGPDHPVVYVDWEQARKFAEWAGGRLPSEAEWDYAARSAGKDYKYPWGNDNPTCERAVLNINSAVGDMDGYGCGRKTSWPVCSKPAGNTDQGLCDMAGNVAEWTQDFWHWPKDENAAPADGSAWESQPGDFRICRGGSYIYSADVNWISTRTGNTPDVREAYTGFRVAR